MSNDAKVYGLLKAAAYSGVLMSGFPFAVVFMGSGYEYYNFVSFAAIFGAWAVFGGCGILAAFVYKRATGLKKRGARLTAFFTFLKNSAFILPLAGFIVVCTVFKVNLLAYLYLAPICIALYFGCMNTFGKSYSDVFSKGWFLLYLFSALYAIVIFAVKKHEEAQETGSVLLCIGFGVMIMLAAVLSNQTNIDENTKRRRSRGKTVLPYGMRRYNALYVTGIFAVTLGLFVFAKPIGKAIWAFFTMLIKGFLAFLRFIAGLMSSEDVPNTGSDPSGVQDMEQSNSVLGTILTAFFIAAGIVLIILFRRDIAEFIRRFFASLFKKKTFDKDMPFFDEILSGGRNQITEKARKKAERDLHKQYRRENDPKRKYRLGYAVFLSELKYTDAPPVPSDVCSDHRRKGESVFGEDLRGLTEAYGRVRYADEAPSAEALSEQEELLRRIVRRR